MSSLEEKMQLDKDELFSFVRDVPSQWRGKNRSTHKDFNLLLLDLAFDVLLIFFDGGHFHRLHVRH